MSVTIWYVNGVKYTGNIVTVAPSGGDYSNLKTAVGAATVDTLFLISPGSYGSYQDIALNKNIKYYIKRNGGSSPSDCVINFASTGNFVHQAGQVILEGLKLSNNQYESFCFTTYNGQAIINKCDIYARFCTGGGAYHQTAYNSVFTVQYSHLRTRYDGQSRAHVGYVNFSKTTLLKVAWSAEVGGWTTYQQYGGTGNFILEDVAPVGTAGYGYNYGSYLITKTVLESILINSSKTTFNIGYVEQLTAVGVYSDGQTEDYTSLVTWSSSNPSVLGVSNSGLIVAYSNGNASITITYDELTFTTNFCIESSVPPLKIVENSSTVLSEFGSSDVIDINNISTCVNLWSSPSSTSIPTTKSIVNYASSIKYPQWRIDADEEVVISSHRAYNINSGMLFNGGEFSLADNSVLFVGTGIN